MTDTMTTANFHFYRPADGHGLPHDPFKAIIAPRPIGWISTLSPDGVVNLAPFSFFNAFCSRPPIVGFASEGPSDTLTNVQATGEFVFNLATSRHADQMNATSLHVPAEVDEMAMVELASAPAREVRPPRIADSPAALECRVLQVIPLTDLEGAPAASTLVLGQVVGVHIDRACLEDGRFRTDWAQPMARCGYLSDYAVVDRLTKLRRPIAG